MKLSKHAQLRSQQRGIPESLLDLVLEYGEPKVVGGDAISYEVSGKNANAIQAHLKQLIQNIDKVKNKVVVTGSDGTIITTYHRKD